MIVWNDYGISLTATAALIVTAITLLQCITSKRTRKHESAQIRSKKRRHKSGTTSTAQTADSDTIDSNKKRKNSMSSRSSRKPIEIVHSQKNYMKKVGQRRSLRAERFGRSQPIEGAESGSTLTKLTSNLPTSGVKSTQSDFASSDSHGSSMHSFDANFNENEQGTQEIYDDYGQNNDSKVISVEPTKLRWNRDGGYQTVSLCNNTKQRRAIKVKCSDNKLYRVNPVFTFIESGNKVNVDIIRKKGDTKVDKMIFVTVCASPDDSYPKPLFNRSLDLQTSTMLPLLVAR